MDQALAPHRSETVSTCVGTIPTTATSGKQHHARTTTTTDARTHARARRWIYHGVRGRFPRASRCYQSIEVQHTVCHLYTSTGIHTYIKQFPCRLSDDEPRAVGTDRYARVSNTNRLVDSIYHRLCWRYAYAQMVCICICTCICRIHAPGACIRP